MEIGFADPEGASVVCQVQQVRVLVGADSIFRTCGVKGKHSGESSKDQCSGELVEDEECVRDP